MPTISCLAFNRFWLQKKKQTFACKCALFCTNYCCFGRSFVLSMYFRSFIFHEGASFHSVQPLRAPGYARLHIRTYKPCTYHNDCCSITKKIIYYITTRVVLTLTHGYNAVRGHRTGSITLERKITSVGKQIKSEEHTYYE